MTKCLYEATQQDTQRDQTERNRAEEGMIKRKTGKYQLKAVGGYQEVDSKGFWLLVIGKDEILKKKLKSKRVQPLRETDRP